MIWCSDLAILYPTAKGVKKIDGRGLESNTLPQILRLIGKIEIAIDRR